ncbi:hypothetical protein CFELI_02515 [Corynebacterium felinum]|uniref:Uncharacterized protein n=1 Tax=Corynebacterium felinum TaxID=131318 RepID=A0ABU2BBM0_9CORY|nr:hypothetical protein [Corynebacterium felinum]WJY94145.1 hypothetical protein CFELI_02515 [Corynebacterium felinum]
MVTRPFGMESLVSGVREAERSSWNEGLKGLVHAVEVGFPFGYSTFWRGSLGFGRVGGGKVELGCGREGWALISAGWVGLLLGCSTFWRGKPGFRRAEGGKVELGVGVRGGR